MEVTRLCGSCHREGTTVSLTRQMSQTNILENYVDSIHGEGLFKRGLTVTAVCTSCHTSHFVLPHTDPRSSIAKQNISKTCTHCRRSNRTSQDHPRRVLGEAAPPDPGLRDCHRLTKCGGVYTQGTPTRTACAATDPKPRAPGRADGLLFTDKDELAHSRHARPPACSATPAATGCHHAAVRTMTARVDCSIVAETDQYRGSTHGSLRAATGAGGGDCHTPRDAGKSDSTCRLSRNARARARCRTGQGGRAPKGARSRSSRTTWRASTARG
jgi:hypothetical protein